MHKSAPLWLHILSPAHQNLETLQIFSIVVIFFKLVNHGHQEHFTTDTRYGDIHLSNNQQFNRTKLDEYGGCWDTSTPFPVGGGGWTVGFTTKEKTCFTSHSRISEDYTELHYTVNTYIQGIHKRMVRFQK
jgi:hypothetical protein